MPASDIAWALEQYGDRVRSYELHDAYWRGEHRLAFATEKFRNAFGSLFQRLKENLCPAVVEAVTDRLFLQGWEMPQAKVPANETPGSEGDGPPKEPPPNPLAQRAQDIWDRNRMAQKEGEVYSKAVRLGDAFVIVAKTATGPRFYVQKSSQMAVRYSEENPDEIALAAKCWYVKTDRKFRLNLYYPDHVERFVTRGTAPNGLPKRTSSWVPYTDETTPEGSAQYEWGVGMPVFHFGYDAETGEYGVSRLRDVVPLQDALNKSLCDMMVSAEFTAYPQRWATGVEPKYDPVTGQEVEPFKTGPGVVWTKGSAEGQFGQFDGADPTGYLSTQDKIRAAIARVTGTPAYLLELNDNAPAADASGESKKTSDTRLVKDVEDLQRSFGETWESAMALALRADGVSAVEGLEAVWGDPETRNEKDQVDTLAVKVEKLGVSKRQALRELGYDEDAIQEMLDEGSASMADVEALLQAQAAGANVTSFAQARARGAVEPGQPVPVNAGGTA